MSADSYRQRTRARDQTSRGRKRSNCLRLTTRRWWLRFDVHRLLRGRQLRLPGLCGHLLLDELQHQLEQILGNVVELLKFRDVDLRAVAELVAVVRTCPSYRGDATVEIGQRQVTYVALGPGTDYFNDCHAGETEAHNCIIVAARRRRIARHAAG